MTLKRTVLFALCVSIVLSSAAFGQSTTGTISGVVTDEDGGTQLPGAQVTAVHEPTGTRYSGVSQNDGRFLIAGVRVGGPYSLTVTMDGFRNGEASDISVKLGESKAIDFQLRLTGVEETITVFAESSPIINKGRTGAASNVSQEEIESLPTVDRNLNDFARTDPFFSVNAENEDPDAITVAGRSGRYNNISIDGSVNNDLFGLSDSGTPGGQAGTTPISLDAIQELELVLADFDVRNGGFSGGAINAVTRSGSNAFKGSVFFFTRDKSFFGDGPELLGEFGEFEEDQFGFRLGGPLSQDKVFFFVNADIEDRSTPTGWSIDGSSGQAFGFQAEADRFRQILQDNYGFDPGGFAENLRDNPSDKYFLRFDFNLGVSHQLTLRHNYVDAGAHVNRPDRFSYEWESETYDFNSETNSTVAQLNSTLGVRIFNEARAAFQSIEDRRQGRGGLQFPWIEVEDIAGDGSRFEFEAGTEPFSTANSLGQDILEIHNDLTILAGNHTVTIGTHNELFSFNNLFVQNFYGSYEFSDLDALEAGLARRYRHTFPNPGQDGRALFDVNQWGLYAGDQWAAGNDLTLTFGLRLDMPRFPDRPPFNPEVQDLYGFDTSEMPSETLVQPRFGFNWDLRGQGDRQLRGGSGIFAGRAPYVWISNQYTVNGIENTFIQATGSIPFNPDPFNQPRNIGGSSTQEVNLIDPNFNFPQVWRTNLAYDHRFDFLGGTVGSVEVVYTDSVEEVDYKNVNIEQTGDSAFDGRPLYTRVSRDFTGAYLITNNDDPSSIVASVKLERPYRDGTSGFVSYAWSDAEDVIPGTSSRAVSNWQFTPSADPNNVPAAAGNFQVEHRFNASISHRFNRDKRFPTTVSAFYNLQSGRPFSWLMNSDFVGFGFGQSFNGDGAGFNDLLYVPASASDVVTLNGTWDDLDRFISDSGLDQYRGQIVPRNTSLAPWNHTLDIHVAQDIPLSGDRHRLQLTFDILNFVNLFDEDSGNLRFAEFNTLTPLELEGFTDEGTPIYNLFNVITDPEDNPLFETHNIRSRWRAKLGIRYNF